jgi:hypothetical protein
VDKIKKSAKPGNKYDEAARYLLPEILDERFSDFLTTLLYPAIRTGTRSSFEKL